ARFAYLVGTPPACGRRRDSRSCGTRCLLLSERRNAEVPHSLEPVHGHVATESWLGYRSEFDFGNDRLYAASVRGAPGELSAAHAPARQGDVDGSNSPRWAGPVVELCEQFQLQLDEQLYLCGRCSASAAERYHHQDHRMVRQHNC